VNYLNNFVIEASQIDPVVASISAIRSVRAFLLRDQISDCDKENAFKLTSLLAKSTAEAVINFCNNGAKIQEDARMMQLIGIVNSQFGNYPPISIMSNIKSAYTIREAAESSIIGRGKFCTQNTWGDYAKTFQRNNLEGQKYYLNPTLTWVVPLSTDLISAHTIQCAYSTALNRPVFQILPAVVSLDGSTVVFPNTHTNSQNLFLFNDVIGSGTTMNGLEKASKVQFPESNIRLMRR
jgi:hypothetical protein